MVGRASLMRVSSVIDPSDLLELAVRGVKSEALIEFRAQISFRVEWRTSEEH